MLRRARPLLGTIVEITVCAADPAAERGACDAGFAAIADVHRLMSFHERDSDVARVNRAAHLRPVEVDPRTAAVLRRARAIAALSRGAFDCTVGARMVELGLLPAGGAPTAARGANHRDVAVDDGDRVRFRRALAIDLGGIAKGFAVDQAVAALARAGASAGCVNAGGDLRVFGDRDWPAAIRRPDAPAACVALPPLRDCALATTADSFAPRGHVIDPATGRAHRRPVSVSVVAASCMDADALTKVVWLAAHPPLPLLERMHARTILLRCSDADSERASAAGLRAGG
jgi:FAD:protein FMN transferase